MLKKIFTTKVIPLFVAATMVLGNQGILASAADLAYVKSEKLEVRKAPDKKSDVVIAVKKNDPIAVYGILDGWCWVRYGEKKGFVKENTLIFENGKPSDEVPSEMLKAMEESGVNLKNADDVKKAGSTKKNTKKNTKTSAKSKKSQKATAKTNSKNNSKQSTTRGTTSTTISNPIDADTYSYTYTQEQYSPVTAREEQAIWYASSDYTYNPQVYDEWLNDYEDYGIDDVEEAYEDYFTGNAYEAYEEDGIIEIDDSDWGYEEFEDPTDEDALSEQLGEEPTEEDPNEENYEDPTDEEGSGEENYEDPTDVEPYEEYYEEPSDEEPYEQPDVEYYEDNPAEAEYYEAPYEEYDDQGYSDYNYDEEVYIGDGYEEGTGNEQYVDAYAGGDRERAVEIALGLVGNPYVYGGNDPVNGIDCSGFTQYVMGQVGISTARTAAEQSYYSRQIEFDQLEPGDCLYYDGNNDGEIDHVSMYIGGGQIVHASNEDTGIIVTDCNYGSTPVAAGTYF